MEEIAGRFVSESVGKVAAVSRNPDSFGEIAVGLKTLWDYFEVELHSTCKIAGGRGPMHSSDQTIANAAQKLFAKSRSIVHSKLDLLRFTFPLRVEAPTAPPINDSPVVDTPTPQLRKGGRPLAEHWDDMWAAIAVALYEGDLKPKTQADIERAMHIWIDERGLEAATSTVRQRARRLWDRMTMQDG